LLAELVQQLHLPRYDKLPATLLGRFARSKLFKGRGLGKLLLIGAMKRALDHSMNIASVAVVVDAIDENARSFTGGMVVSIFRITAIGSSCL
jgi:hypothetical protein